MIKITINKYTRTSVAQAVASALIQQHISRIQHKNIHIYINITCIYRYIDT